MYSNLIDINEFKGRQTPTYAYVSVSNICNANCVFCDVHENKCKKPSVDVYSVLKQLKDVGVKYVQFTGGGEPFANVDILKYMQYASDIGLNIIFLSNAIALKKEIIDKLKTINLKAAFFSLDSHQKQIHDKTRGVDGCFDNLVKSVNYLKECLPNVPVVINHVLHKTNIDELTDFITFKQTLNYDFLNPIVVKECPELYFTREQIEKFNQQKDDILKLAQENNVKILYGHLNLFSDNDNTENGDDLRKNEVKCYVVKHTCFVDCVSGNVYPCDCSCHRDKNYYSYGNLKTSHLSEIFNSEKFNKLNEELTRGFSKCKSKCDYANVLFNELLGN